MGLTNRIVETASYRGQGNAREVFWDDDPVGLGLRVFTSGRKTFVLSFRPNVTTRLLTLGDFGVLRLEDARKRARTELLAVEIEQAAL